MTYSIVARDDETGALGVAVETCFLRVGAIVPWVEPGVGAVATQSLAEVSYGPLGLDAMRGGTPAPDALAALRDADAGYAVRQVAMVDASGRVAAHTGAQCVREAGHLVGDGFSVQANMMAKATVWGAMAEAFTTTSGRFADRLLAALDAAQAEGGDFRGQQSAAIKVAAGERAAVAGHGVLVDMRVDDHADPLRELRRLVDRNRAYATLDEAEGALAAGELARALALGEQAIALAPGVPDPVVVVIAVLFLLDRTPDARAAVERFPGDRALLAKYVGRFAESGFFPADPETAARLFA